MHVFKQRRRRIRKYLRSATGSLKKLFKISMEDEGNQEFNVEEDDVKTWLHNLVPDEQEGSVMDTGILDEDIDNAELSTTTYLRQTDSEGDSSAPLKLKSPPTPPPVPQMGGPSSLAAGTNSRDSLETSTVTFDNLKCVTASQTDTDRPVVSGEPTNSQMKDLYKLNKIARAKKELVPTLGGGISSSTTDVGSFYNSGDNRANAVKLGCEVSGNVTKSVSFNPSNMKCYLCKESLDHRVLVKLGGRSESNRVVFVVSDQGFPATLPSKSEGDCLKIIRIENGTLEELKRLFLSTVSGHWIPPGSVLLVGSLSELVSIGLAGYLENLISFNLGIKQKFGNSVQVVPFVPMLMGGLDKAFGVRCVAELAAWLGGTGDYPLVEFTRSVWDFLAKGGVGGSQPPYESRLKLPMDLSGLNTRTVQSNGWTFLHCGSIAIDEAEELKQITALIRDLNKGFALTLDECPDFNRSPTATATAVGGGKKPKFLVMGASHASRLATALKNGGCEVIDLSDKRWRLSRLEVETLREKFERMKVDLHRDTQVVLSVLDSALFWGETEEGAAPARKLADNRFHLEGRVKLAGREVVIERFEVILPILQMANKFRVALLSPIPRYITGGCCQEEGHCQNWDTVNFASDQLRDLERVRNNLRDCVFRANDRAVKSVKIVNPVKLFGGGRDLGDTAQALKAVWGGDPVHPSPEVYQRIAEELVAELTVTGVPGGGRGQKRKRSPERTRDSRDIGYPVLATSYSSRHTGGGGSHNITRGRGRGGSTSGGGSANWYPEYGNRGRNQPHQSGAASRGGYRGRRSGGWRGR